MRLQTDVKMQCKVSGLKGENCGLFHSDSREDGERKNVEQKHQRATEEGVKREKGCEIFSTESQQVVKSAMGGWAFIAMNSGRRLRNEVVCLIVIDKEKWLINDKLCSINIFI